MTSFINALDKYTSKQPPLQLGENGHSEYGWSSDIIEKIVQFQFQIVRTNSSQQFVLAGILRELLQKLYNKNSLTEYCDCTRTECLRVLYCILAQTRDIVDGKGEYTLSYMMILTWYDFFPELAKYALETFVLSLTDTYTHPYGSWKDMKYFAKYAKDAGCPEDHPLILHILSITNRQLRADNLAIASATCASVNQDVAAVYCSISLASRWIPRQKSARFGWLHRLLAADYFKEYLETCTTIQQKKSAMNKCLTHYRQLLSKLNRHLDTIQIKQCDHLWADIDHAKTPSITMLKQRKALYNVTKSGKQRSYDKDRVQCAENLKQFLESRIKSGNEIKGKRVGLIDFTKNAKELIEQNQYSPMTGIEIEMLNSQWRDNGASTGALSNFIAMVDTSGSMTWEGGDPYNAAIALGIRVAEKSTIGKRVMTFSTEPVWVNLDHCTGFVDMVKEMEKSNGLAGTGTNFYKALDLCLNAMVENQVSIEDAKNMVLVIFSDMQISEGDVGYKSMYAGIVSKYVAAGYSQPPHILFWNLRSKNGSPALSRDKNVSEMSGFSPALLNQFCEKGIEALANLTPWTNLLESLDNPRYANMSKKLEECI